MKAPCGADDIMIALIICCLLSTALTQESTTENNNESKTTLYPIQNITTNKTKDGTKIKGSATVWKIDTTYAQPKLQDNNETESREQPVIEKPDNIIIKEFIPSPHLETYIEEVHDEPNLEHYYPKKPPEGFRFPNDFNGAPFLDIGSKDGWKIAQPITIKAGDLYKLPDVYKGNNGVEHNYNLGVKNEKPVRVKKKMEPWRGLLQLMTAFIPVGLIISALTPNVVTIQSNGPYSPVRNNNQRRGDIGDLNVSEGCRRRILCELHQDHVNLDLKLNRKRRPKPCSRFYCEDPSSVTQLTDYILKHSNIIRNTRGDIIT